MDLEETLGKIVELSREELDVVRKRAEEKTAARDHGHDRNCRVKASSLGRGKPRSRVTEGLCCSMSCWMMPGGAPPKDAAKEDGDQKCPCMMCRFTWPVNSDRIRRAGTRLRLFTRAGTATLGGYPASRCT